MLIKNKHICAFAGANPRLRRYVFGEKVLAAGDIFKIGKNPDLCTATVLNFTAYCYQSSENKANPHEINGEIQKGKVLNVVCTCQAGASEKCKHCIAVLLYICYRVEDDLPVLSCTDKKCGWKKEHKELIKNAKTVPYLKHTCKSQNKKKSVNASLESSTKISAAPVLSTKDSSSDSDLLSSKVTGVEKLVEISQKKAFGEKLGQRTNLSSVKSAALQNVSRKRKVLGVIENEAPSNKICKIQQVEVIDLCNNGIPSTRKENSPVKVKVYHDPKSQIASNDIVILNQMSTQIINSSNQSDKPKKSSSAQQRLFAECQGKTSLRTIRVQDQPKTVSLEHCLASADDHGTHEKSQLPDILLSKNMESTILQIYQSDLPIAAITKHISGRHYSVFKVEQPKCSLEDILLIRGIFDREEGAIMKVIHKSDVEPLLDCCAGSFESLIVDDCAEICLKTRDNFAIWKEMRFFRITGSICYGLYTYCSNKKPDWKKKCSGTFMAKDFKSEYCEYGKKNERPAREAYVFKTKRKVVESGLIISKLNPWLGYSPDGLIFVDGKLKAILEIKCPCSGKDGGIAEVLEDQTNKCLKKVTYKIGNQEFEKLEMNKKHRFYGQVQLGMAVVDVERAHFVLYSSFDKDIFLLDVKRDNAFIMKMLTALKTTYFLNIIHNKCLIRKSESTACQETSDEEECDE